MTNILVRFEPPAHPVPRTAADLKAVITTLRAHPGQWALLGSYSTPGTARQGAYEIRKGLRPSLFGPEGTFETHSTSMFGEHRVYVRYIGGAR